MKDNAQTYHFNSEIIFEGGLVSHENTTTLTEMWKPSAGRLCEQVLKYRSCEPG